MWWRYILVNSADMSVIGRLNHARDRQLQLVHNRAGMAQFRYPMDEEMFSHRIVPFKTGILAIRYNWRASLLAGRSVWDDIWSGYVLPQDRDVSGGWKTVSCVGWLNRLEKRFLRREKNYGYTAGVNTDDAVIIHDLLDEMNANPSPGDGYTYTPMTGSSSLTLMGKGSKLPNEGVGGATAYQPAYRGMSYTRDQQALQAIIDLTETENGCDLTVHPRTRVMDLYRKYMRDLPNVKFGFNKWPRNVQTLNSPVESEKTVNYMLVRGSPLSVPRYQDDTFSMAEFGPLEEVITLSDVVDNASSPTGSILQYYASAEVALRAWPPETLQITPFPYTPGSSIPEPFVDYRMGDRPRFSGKRGQEFDYSDHPVRVFGMSVNIDNEGNEKLAALQAVPS